MPESIAVNAAGEVFIGFNTDVLTGGVGRFTPEGTLVRVWDTRQGWPLYVADSGDGGVFVAYALAWNWGPMVGRYSADGAFLNEWPVSGLQSAIASVPRGTGAADVYVIAALDEGTREVRRYGPTGGLRSALRVCDRAYELAAFASGATGDAALFVAAPPSTPDGNTVIWPYGTDGLVSGQWEVDGRVRAMDVDAVRGRLWMAVTSVDGWTGSFQETLLTGYAVSRCPLTGLPVDLAAGESGDAYVITEDSRDPRTRRVLRYREDCTLLDTWDLEKLNGHYKPTPSGTATAIPAASATYTPCDSGWPLFLPLAVRGGA